MLLSPLPSRLPVHADTAPDESQLAAPVGIQARSASAIQVSMGNEQVEVRLLGLDPIPADDPQAWDAIAFLDAMVAGRPLQIESCGDPEALSSARHVSVLGAAGDPPRWVNGELVSQGLARVGDDRPAGCYVDVLLNLEATARAERRGLWANLPVEPVPPALRPLRSHDWRRPGFASVVDGKLYDSYCAPMQSVGSNMPNLPFRGGLTETLEWMRTHNMRWMRVFATGHGPRADWAPGNAVVAAERLKALVAKVEAFNLSHPPAESIYVLVTLTNYYPPGVPGDRYAFDHPEWSEAPVLPAPWYRPGVQRYSFDQAHGPTHLVDQPNYEIYYKPWVKEIVSTLARSPAVLGWQLGNELKARGSLPNDIPPELAYEWYMEFTAEMVDTIREIDQNHLVFMGAQYLAELADWDYRPLGKLDLDRRAIYDALINRALRACERHCWNVWSLTSYDFSPYPVDDAMRMSRAGVAAMMTEYGFTRGTPDQMRIRYGGDRPAALRNGLDRPWVTVEGTSQPRMWGASELIQKASLAGIAPWASPAPGPWAGFDADNSRGITSAPDERGLWDAWSEVSSRLETANRAAGVSTRCLGFQSSRDGAELAAAAGQAARISTSVASCAVLTRGGIGNLLDLDSQLRDRLGCPVIAERGEPFVEQLFEGGHMLWRPQTGQVLVTFFGEGRFVPHRVDTLTAAHVDPPLVSPSGRLVPTGRFGRLWGEVDGLRDRLGWAVSTERGFDGAAQEFVNGTMVWTGDSQRLIRAYYADGTTVYIPEPVRP
jgi:hypothetical protein